MRCDSGGRRVRSLEAASEAVNVDWRREVYRNRDRLLAWLLPPRCLLCSAAGVAGRDLCAGCRADFAINLVCCSRCALPLDQPALLCGRCLKREPAFDSAWVPFVYGHPLDLLETRFKFGGDLAAGRVLADAMIDRALIDRPALPGLLMPVPLHRKRLRQRGYNQALELATPIAKALGIPINANRLQRKRDTAPQTGLDAPARRRNLAGAFELINGDALPAHVALFDDVMTTGSTLGECARLLRKAGVDRVDVWALARAPAKR